MARSLDTPVVRPTLYDFGETIGAWAEGVLDLVPRGRLVLVGNSVGGSCAIEVAARVPRRVDAVVLVAAKAGHRPEPEVRDEAVRILEEHGVAPAWARYWEPLFSPRADPAVVASARDMALEQSVDDIIRGVRVFHGRPDRSEFVEQLRAHVIVVRGERDPLGRNAGTPSRSVPSREFHEIPGVGHYVPLEAPTELARIVASAVDDETDSRARGDAPRAPGRTCAPMQRPLG